MQAVILLSGGIDSTTCLADAVAEFGADQVTALTFTYGQKHAAELDNARRIADYYQVNLVEAEVDRRIFTGSTSTLLEGNGDISKVAYEAREAGTVDTYVPFRNGLMLSQAAALAYSLEAPRVYYGAHADDAAGAAYPDCSPEFYAATNQSIQLGTAGAVSLYAPFIQENKAGIVKRGLDLGVPYHLTRSCYEGQDLACGECGTCRDRLAAFAANSVADPIAYAIERAEEV